MPANTTCPRRSTAGATVGGDRSGPPGSVIGRSAENALLLGYLMYRSRLVPRLIPTLGLIGGPLLISSAVGTIFGINDPVSVLSGVALVPIFFWELFLGLWMTFKGFQRSAPLMLEAAAQAASLEGSATTVPSRGSVAATAGVA